MNLMEASVSLQDGRAILSLARDGEAISPAGSGFRRRRGRAARRRAQGDPRHPSEAITDRDGADRNSNAVEIVEAHVEVVEPAGSDTFVVTHIAGKEVTARMRADADVMAGTRVPFAFNLDKAVLFDPGTGRRL